MYKALSFLVFINDLERGSEILLGEITRGPNERLFFVDSRRDFEKVKQLVELPGALLPFSVEEAQPGLSEAIIQRNQGRY